MPHRKFIARPPVPCIIPPITRCRVIHFRDSHMGAPGFTTQTDQLQAAASIPRNRFLLEPILLSLLGLAFFALTPPKIHLALLNGLHHSPLWSKRSPGLFQLGLFYGISSELLALISYLCIRSGSPLLPILAAHLLAAPRAAVKMLRARLNAGLLPQTGTLCLLIALLIGAAARAYYLAAPMKCDEAGTFFQVLSPFPFILEYFVPNNHVLNTLLEKISMSILGDSPFAARLPAFLCGLFSTPLIFKLSRAFKPAPSGYFSAAALAIWPFLILYSANGRGYSLVVLLTLLLVLLGLHYLTNPTPPLLALISLASALGLLTMPSMLFMVAGLFTWIAALLLTRAWTLRSILLHFAAPFAGLTFAFTALFYTPVVIVSNGFQGIVHNTFVKPQPFNDFLHQLTSHLRDTFITITDHIPPATLAVFAFFLLAGFFASAVRRQWPMFLLLPLTLLGSAVILFAQHRIPFPRTWIFLVPIFILLADAGFTLLLDLVGRPVRPVLLASLFLAAATLATRYIASYPAQVYSQFPEAAVAAEFLQPLLRPGDTVITSASVQEPTFFYLWYRTTFLDPVTHKPLKPQELFFKRDSRLNYSFMSYRHVDDTRVVITSDPTAPPHTVYYITKKAECTIDNSSTLHLLIDTNTTLQFPSQNTTQILDYGDMLIYRQTPTADHHSPEIH